MPHPSTAVSGKNYNRIVCAVLSLILGSLFIIKPSLPGTVAKAAASFLSSVAHDATLTGDGTTSAPLGISNNAVGTAQMVNGAVTAPKIASGQVVKTINGLNDNVNLAAGSNVSLALTGQTLTISSLLGLTSVAHDSTLAGDGTSAFPLSIAPSQVVRSINNLSDNITFLAGSNITITPDGNTLTVAANPPPQPYINPLRVATLQWYEANRTGLTFSTGQRPTFLAFDGANIWVANEGPDTVTKIRASDGVTLGVFSVGSDPRGIAFDGANIWVANVGPDTVTKLRTSDGVILGVFNVGIDPQGVVFDGANVWVANYSSNSVTKLRASDGATLGTFGVGNNLQNLAFDGANMSFCQMLGMEDLRRRPCEPPLVVRL
jgi:hypothetical protein